MIKLIVSDMDGTLLKENKKPDEEIYNLLPKLKEKGIRFVVASGRQYPSLKKIFQEYLEDVMIIAENGAFVVDNHKEIFVQTINQEQRNHCIAMVDSVDGIEPIFSGKYCSYTTSASLCEYLSSPMFQYEIEVVENLYAIEKDCLKISMIVHTGRDLIQCYKELKGKLDPEFTLVISGDNCMDIQYKEVSKGAAIKALQETWGICLEETLVFCDQYNDIEMFSQAYYSYAMKNASPDVKKYARFEADSNNEGGVVKGILEQIQF